MSASPTSRQGGSCRIPARIRRRGEELRHRSHRLRRGDVRLRQRRPRRHLPGERLDARPRAGGTPAPPAALYRNLGDGTFRDVTAEAGVANERWGQGVCAGDFDNDGDEDLYVTNFGVNRLYRNEGGRFTDIATRAGVAVDSWSTGCAFGDYDGDGWLDLYVAGYVASI